MAVLNRSMQFIKPPLLHLYFYGTAAYRKRALRELTRSKRVPIVVPVFHRVANDRANDWTTSTAEFRAAVDWLKENFELISLEEAQRRVANGGNDRPSVSITFDDGYAVNCDDALPLLIEEGIPCTYFVSTGPVLEGKGFEHDRAMGNHFSANSVAQLRELSAAGIEIAAHSRTHADLGKIRDAEHLFDELVAARNDLQDALGAPVRYFAFPFGLHANMTAEAFRLARESGYAGVCSAYGGYNFPGDDPFHIQRRGVDGNSISFRNWTSIDPWHPSRVRRFEYRQEELAPCGPRASEG